MQELRGKVCLLTGASRGLGEAIARRLAKEGMSLALVARNKVALEKLAESLGSTGGKTRVFAADVSDIQALPKLVEEVMRSFGRIDALVNNAGVENFGHYEATPPDDIAQTIAINLTASLVLTRLVLPHLLAQKEGQVVNMASVAGLGGVPYGAIYSATKAALLAATSSLRQEFPQGPVGFSAVVPGFVHGAGMHEIHKREAGKAPALVGSTTLEAVVEATLVALRKSPPEVIVNSMPLRPLYLGRLFPSLGDWIVRTLIGEYLRKIADARQADSEPGAGLKRTG